MDKKTAFKILNIDKSATFEQAKKAYRTMAKKYHPDVDKTNHGSHKNSEDRMKKINLAFCYLAPVLQKKNMVKEPKEKPEKQNNTNKVNKAKKSENLFFHNIFNSLSKLFVNKKNNQAFSKNRKKRYQTKNRNIRQNGFDDILKNAHKDIPSNKIRKPRRLKKSSYNMYQEYLMLKKKIKLGQSKTDPTMGIGKVEKINPVRPVNPVGRH